MPSEKVAKILRSKTDMTRDQIDALSDNEAWDRVYAMRSAKARDERLEVCFTGFGRSKKEELAELAEAKGFKVVKSVTKNLHFLCGDEDAGDKKVADAEAKGAQILSESEFRQLAETGELPASGSRPDG
jgi:NAD-dependent DNA ligase